MNLNLAKFVPNSVSLKAGRLALQTQAHSPTILFGAGVVGMVASTVLACRATLKIEEVLDENADMRLKIKDTQLNSSPDVYSEADAKKDMTVLYVQTAVKLTKLYAPAFAIGVLSVASLTKSHSILNRRNAAVTAAYAAVDQSFREYRSRVQGELGEEKEKELRYGVEQIEELEEGTNGPKKVKRKAATNNGASQYAVLFDESNPNWHTTREYSQFFIRTQQNYLNDRLHSHGSVSLNDAYDALGFPRTRAGYAVGWVLGSGGDDYIDFGLFSERNGEQMYDFMVGREGAIWLDFNVNGVLIDLLKKQ